MSNIQRVDINLEKGLVIIVGKEILVKVPRNSENKEECFFKMFKSEKERKYYTDGVVIYDSFCLSDSSPYLLQDNICITNSALEEPKHIYLCGHGKSNGPKISRLTMQKIAQYLFENFNTIIGNTTKIHIMACYALKHDMANLLKKELIAIDAKYKNIVVDGFSNDTTLVTNYKNSICVMDIKFKGGENFYTVQEKLQKKLSCDNIELELKGYKDILKSKYNNLKADIEGHNREYMKLR